jgi:chromosome segregation ATPase
MIADNKGLRDRIDEYRRDHVLFRLQCGRFEEQLAATAHDIERVIRDSKHIFEEREDIAARIQELRDLADEEQKAYMAQCRELNGVLQAFDEIEAKPSAIGVQLDFADVFGNMTEEQEEELQKKIVKGGGGWRGWR